MSAEGSPPGGDVALFPPQPDKASATRIVIDANLLVARKVVEKGEVFMGLLSCLHAAEGRRQSGAGPLQTSQVSEAPPIRQARGATPCRV